MLLSTYRQIIKENIELLRCSKITTGEAMLLALPSDTREAMDEKEVSVDWWSAIHELAPLKLEALSISDAKARLAFSGRGDYIIVPQKGSIRIGNETPNSL